MISSSQKS